MKQATFFWRSHGADDDAKRLKQALKILDSGDFARAVPLLKNLSDAGLPEAQFEFARLLLFGTGLSQNKVLAVLLLSDASEAQFEKATFALKLLGEEELLQAAVLADLKREAGTAARILGPLVRRNASSRAKYLLATLYERAGGAYFDEAILLYVAASLEGVEEAAFNLKMLKEQRQIRETLLIEALIDNPYLKQ